MIAMPSARAFKSSCYRANVFNKNVVKKSAMITNVEN